MGEMKHRERDGREKKAKPSLKRMERIVGKSGKTRSDIDKRQNPHAEKPEKQQGDFTKSAGAANDGRAPRAQFVRQADGVPAYGERDINRFCNRRSHAGGLSNNAPSGPTADSAPSSRTWRSALNGPQISMK